MQLRNRTVKSIKDQYNIIDKNRKYFENSDDDIGSTYIDPSMYNCKNIYNESLDLQVFLKNIFFSLCLCCMIVGINNPYSNVNNVFYNQTKNPIAVNATNHIKVNNDEFKAISFLFSTNKITNKLNLSIHFNQLFKKLIDGYVINKNNTILYNRFADNIKSLTNASAIIINEYYWSKYGYLNNTHSAVYNTNAINFSNFIKVRIIRNETLTIPLNYPYSGIIIDRYPFEYPITSFI